MSGFAADLPGIGAAATALRRSVDTLDVDLSASGDVGPGRLGPAVAALLAGAQADLDRVRGTVTGLAESAEQVRDSYADVDTDAATGFERGSW